MSHANGADAAGTARGDGVPGPPYTCPYCKVAKDTREAFDKHLRMYHGGRPKREGLRRILDLLDSFQLWRR